MRPFWPSDTIIAERDVSIFSSCGGTGSLLEQRYFAAMVPFGRVKC